MVASNTIQVKRLYPLTVCPVTMMAATNTIWFAFCLLLVAAGDGLLVDGDDGEDGRLAPFALDDQARAFGREYMQVDKKKMKHRRRILIRGAPLVSATWSWFTL